MKMKDFGKYLAIAGATAQDASNAMWGRQTGALDDYMEVVRQQEENSKRKTARKAAVSAYETGGIDGLANFVKDNTDNEYVLEEGAGLAKTIKSISEPSFEEKMVSAFKGFGNVLGYGEQGGDLQKSIDNTVNSDWDLTSISGGGMKAENVGSKLKQAGEKDEQKELSDKFGQAGRIVQGFRNLEGYGKSMDKEGLGTTERQIVSNFRDAMPYLSEELQDKYTSLLNYTAQQQEVKIGALPILSGQARYVVDLAKAIDKTVPQPGLSKKNRQNLISQSIRNQMSLIYGIQNGFFNAQNLTQQGINPESSVTTTENGEIPLREQSLLKSIQLTPEQEKNIEEAIDYVLEAEKLSGGKFEGKENEEYNEYLKLIGQ